MDAAAAAPEPAWDGSGEQGHGGAGSGEQGHGGGGSGCRDLRGAAAGAGSCRRSTAGFTLAALTQSTGPICLRSLIHALQNSLPSSSSAASRAASKQAVPFLCYSWLIQPTVSSGREHFAAED